MRYSARKIPLRVDGHGPASSTDSSTWGSYEQAAASREGVGVGFVLNGDGIACVDLDHCIKGGVLAPWAQRLVDRAPGAYVEVSPSGDGLHLWGFASVPQGRVVSTPDGGKAEVYGWGRYITVTSRKWGDTPSRLGDLSALVGELIS